MGPVSASRPITALYFQQGYDELKRGPVPVPACLRPSRVALVHANRVDSIHLPTNTWGLSEHSAEILEQLWLSPALENWPPISTIHMDEHDKEEEENEEEDGEDGDESDYEDSGDVEGIRRCDRWIQVFEYAPKLAVLRLAKGNIGVDHQLKTQSLEMVPVEALDESVRDGLLFGVRSIKMKHLHNIPRRGLLQPCPECKLPLAGLVDQFVLPEQMLLDILNASGREV
ncbi:hypothetical protein V3481_012132 [Fusarium oxysporum f. sp. vasinfectum]|nr:hypothetical protein DER44DRAFT_832723 [Fusarium oxysporum]